MKKLLTIILFTTFCSFLFAQNISGNTAELPISQRLYNFSPLAEIIVSNLGMTDRNRNGVIDKNANEGYEEFVERYGIGDTFAEKEQSIDRGFHANGVTYGAANGRLEEPEIVNHYYINIRFNFYFT